MNKLKEVQRLLKDKDNRVQSLAQSGHLLFSELIELKMAIRMVDDLVHDQGLDAMKPEFPNGLYSARSVLKKLTEFYKHKYWIYPEGGSTNERELKGRGYYEAVADVSKLLGGDSPIDQVEKEFVFQGKDYELVAERQPLFPKDYVDGYKIQTDLQELAAKNFLDQYLITIKMPIPLIKDASPTFGLFHVNHNGKHAELSWDEMLGLVASITLPEERPCLNWLKTPEQEKREREAIHSFNEVIKQYPVTEKEAHPPLTTMFDDEYIKKMGHLGETNQAPSPGLYGRRMVESFDYLGFTVNIYYENIKYFDPFYAFVISRISPNYSEGSIVHIETQEVAVLRAKAAIYKQLLREAGE